MKYFLDTEFMEDGKTIELISIGLVREDGATYYAVNQEANLSLANEWVRKNVLPQLPPYSDTAWKTRKKIRDDIFTFAHPSMNPEFWAYFADYDWVVFCQLFGRMIDLPMGYPQFCKDLRQSLDEKDVYMHHSEFRTRTEPMRAFPRQTAGNHHALEDALWNKRLYEFLYNNS